MMEMKWLRKYILQVHYDAIERAVSMPRAQTVRPSPIGDIFFCFLLLKSGNAPQPGEADKAYARCCVVQANTVAEFHERVTMRMNGDEPDDSVGYSDYLKLHSITNNDYLAADIEKPLLFICSKGDKYYRFADVMPKEVGAM